MPFYYNSYHFSFWRAGSIFHNGRLNIYGPPTSSPERTFPRVVQAIEGKRFVIHCPVAGFPIQEVQWFKGIVSSIKVNLVCKIWILRINYTNDRFQLTESSFYAVYLIHIHKSLRKRIAKQWIFIIFDAQIIQKPFMDILGYFLFMNIYLLYTLYKV